MVEQSGNCTIVLSEHLLDCAIVSSSCSTVVHAEGGRVDCELCFVSVHLATWTSSCMMIVTQCNADLSWLA